MREWDRIFLDACAIKQTLGRRINSDSEPFVLQCPMPYDNGTAETVNPY